MNGDVNNYRKDLGCMFQAILFDPVRFWACDEHLQVSLLYRLKLLSNTDCIMRINASLEGRDFKQSSRYY
jgi:hypothetical protein